MADEVRKGALRLLFLHGHAYISGKHSIAVVAAETTFRSTFLKLQKLLSHVWNLQLIYGEFYYLFAIAQNLILYVGIKYGNAA